MATKIARKPGRPLKAPSVQMSESIVKAFLVNGESTTAIANRYNKKFEKDGSGRHFSPQAVQGRIDRFRAKFPAKVEAILGSIQAPVAETADVEGAACPAGELVTA